MTIGTLLSGQFVRFFAVVLTGLVVDLGIAWTLSMLTPWPLWVCATVGFLAGAAANYALHELWTFRAEDSRLSGRRAATYLSAMLVTLAVRYAILAAIPEAGGAFIDLARLTAAAGASFVVNYLLTRFVVFAQKRV